MKVVRHHTIADFCQEQRVQAFLLADEVAHNIILGVTLRRMQRQQKEGASETSEVNQNDNVYVAHVENAAGDIVGAVMLAAPPHHPVLSNILDKAAIPAMVLALTEVYNTLPGVLGKPDDALLFAQHWQEKTGQDFVIQVEQGVYKLGQKDFVQPPAPGGEARIATQDDLDLLVAWKTGFARDIGIENTSTTREQKVRQIQQLFDLPICDGFHLWVNKEGEPVSMAVCNRETAHSANISYVYTPPEHRRSGYASALTAFLAQKVILADGNAKKQCASLYTDLSNPTSNKIYQSIGFQHVCNHRFIKFHEHAKEV